AVLVLDGLPMVSKPAACESIELGELERFDKLIPEVHQLLAPVKRQIAVLEGEGLDRLHPGHGEVVAHKDGTPVLRGAVDGFLQGSDRAAVGDDELNPLNIEHQSLPGRPAIRGVVDVYGFVIGVLFGEAESQLRNGAGLATSVYTVNTGFEVGSGQL